MEGTGRGGKVEVGEREESGRRAGGVRGRWMSSERRKRKR